MNILLLATLAAAVATSNAGPTEFDFADPKGVNGMQIRLDTPLEPILGLAGGVRGRIRFDPTDPGATSSYVEVPVSAIHFVNPAMTRVAQGSEWFDAERHPVVRFEIRSAAVRSASQDGRHRLALNGEFECRGVKRPLAIEVEAHYLSGRLGERVKGKTGDLLVLRGAFSVRRSEFGMKEDPGFLLVADEVEVRFAVVGMAAR